MPYIGNTIRAADDYRLIDDISSGFNGSETSFALQVAGSAPVPFPKSPQQVLISVNGVIQEPDPTGSSGFNLVGTNIVFSSAPTNGHAFFGIIYATADYLNAGGNFPAGSLGAPSITFIGDENTGLFRKSGGSVGFVSDATEIANFDSNGITISSGNLIIPDSIIHNGDTDTKIRFSAANTVSVETGGSARAVIDSTGLEVTGSVHASSDLRMGEKLKHANDQDTFISFPSNDHIGFTTNNTTRMTIDNSGRVGIGSTTPGMKVTIVGNNEEDVVMLSTGNAQDNTFISVRGDNEAGIRIRGGGSGRGGEIELAGGGRNTDPAVIKFSTTTGSSFTERMRIDSAGSLLIGGTTSIGSNYKLQAFHATDCRMALANTTAASSQEVNLQFLPANSVTGALITCTSEEDFSTSANRTARLTFSTRLNGTLSEAMRIDSSGNVGIGTTSPSAALEVINSSTGRSYTVSSSTEFVVERNGNSQISIIAANDSDSILHFSDTDDENVGLIGYDHANDSMNFRTNAAERMRIDSSGRVGIGCTPTAQFNHSILQIGNQATLGANGALSTTGQTYLTHNLYFDPSGNYQVFNTSNANEGTIFRMFDGNFQFSNSAQTTGTPTVTERLRITSSGNVLINTTTEIAKLTLKGTNNNGSSCYVVTSSGKAVQGIDLNCTTVGDGNFGGAISFGCGGNGRSAIAAVQSGSDDDRNGLAFFTHHSTTGSDNAAEVMRLTSDGRLGIGTTSPDHIFEVEDNNSSFATSRSGANLQLLFKSNSVGQAAQIQVSESSGGGIFQLFTKDTSGTLAERLRVHPAGELSLATTSTNLQGGGASDFFFTLLANTGSNHNGMMVSGVANNHAAHTTRPSANHLYFAGFFLNNAGSGVGNIEVGLSGTSFHTSSDYRLKENVVSISDGITRLKQLSPKRFNWIIDETNTLQDGFLAHEVSSIVPEAISGEKDAVATEDGGQYAKGDPIYQQIDHSKLVPLLTAALQEEIAKREALESRVAALEAA